MTLPPVLVKICGLSTPATLAAAIAAGADRIGLVFFAKSPRNVSLAQARELAGLARGEAAVVALTVDAVDEALARIVDTVAPDWLQLHGAETPERVAEIRNCFGIPVMKALGVAAAEDVATADRYRTVADAILFDAKPPRGAMLPGGNGAAFDWTLLRGPAASDMLSGGLSPANVAEALRITGARSVDVSSGVESAPGMKDVAKIRAFIEAARGPALV